MLYDYKKHGGVGWHRNLDEMIKIFVFVGVLARLSRATCPEGAIEGLNPSDCYIFVAEPKGWSDAENDCVMRKGHLTSIPDAFHNAFLMKELATISTSPNGSWIGANTVLTPSGSMAKIS